MAAACPSKLDRSLPIQRKWIPAERDTSTGTANGEGGFTVLSYNILGDCHVTTRTYPYLPHGCRTINERHPQLLMELEHHNDADIVCLQEVNKRYFEETVAPAMSQLGFTGIQSDKALGVDEGLATFYKHSRFYLEHHQVVYFKDQMCKEVAMLNLPKSQSEAILERTLKDTVTMFLRLHCKQTGERVTLGNVHPFWMNHIAMDVITLQIAFALNTLVCIAGGEKGALLLCGDFNTQPHMPGYQLLTDGYLNNKSMTALRSFDIVPKGEQAESFQLFDVMPTVFSHHPIPNFRSAYKEIMGSEVPFSQFHDTQGTEWKKMHYNGTTQEHLEQQATDDDSGIIPSTRPKGKQIKALDYLWFSSETLGCDGVLEMVPKQVLDAFYACPNAVFPSDHLLMKARFHFKDRLKGCKTVTNGDISDPCVIEDVHDKN